jgi:signal transduction histidine kinase
MTERLSRELRVFYELARVVAAGPYHVDDVLDRICTEVRQAFGFERALLVRYRPEDETVHAVVQQNVDWPGDAWLPLEMFPFLQRARDERRTVFVADPRAERAIPGKIIERFGVGSIVAVPLAVENRCPGFLVLDRSGAEFALEEENVELLTALGCVAAVLIEKADQFTELQQAMEELRSVDEAKSQFISIASHELRTPIAVVHGIASTLYLRGDDLTPSQLEQLRSTLFQQTQRLTELATQLLDLSRLEAGAVAVQSVRFHPRAWIDELLIRIAPDRIEDIEVAVDPALEVVTDPDAFERVVSNLITNAFRYGLPPVVVRAETTNGPFRLVVEDRGAGVEPTFVPRLFEKFSRNDPERTELGGAGLGLSIAHSFAQAIGGDLTYEPAQPNGARFALELPGAIPAA